MKTHTKLAAAVAVLVTAYAAPVLAGGHGHGAFMRPPHALPPISGTIRVHPGERGYGFGYGMHGLGSWRGAHQVGAFRPAYGSAGRGSRSFGSRPVVQAIGPAYGFQGHAYAQLSAANAGPRYAFSAAHRTYGWRGDGTGLVGLIGNGGGPVTPDMTRWGTADSATTGGSYDPAATSRTFERPVRVTYGEPDLWAAAAVSPYPYPPTGGLAYYSSGSPGRLGYYSSGSSAGPGGSPGGLAIYSSGSYGPGPAILHVRHRRYASAGYGCTCGPKIITRDHHRWASSW